MVQSKEFRASASRPSRSPPSLGLVRPRRSLEARICAGVAALGVAGVLAGAAATPASAAAASPDAGPLASTPAPATAPLVCLPDSGVLPVPAIGARLVASESLTADPALVDAGDEHGTYVAEAVLSTWPWARIASVRVLEGGQVTPALLPRAIDRCLALGAQVIVVATVGDRPQSQAIVDDMRGAVLRARDAGVDVVIAAGNLGGEVLYPGDATADIAVVVDATDGAVRCSFASTGPEVLVGAPGCPTLLPSKDGTGWEEHSGSSFAAPQVAAALAAMQAYAPSRGIEGRRAVLAAMPNRVLDQSVLLRLIGRSDLLPADPSASTGSVSSAKATPRVRVSWASGRLNLTVTRTRKVDRVVVRRRGTKRRIVTRRVHWTVPRSIAKAGALLDVRVEDARGRKLAGRAVRVPSVVATARVAGRMATARPAR